MSEEKPKKKRKRIINNTEYFRARIKPSMDRATEKAIADYLARGGKITKVV